MHKLLIFGSGRLAKTIFDNLKKGVEAVAFIDNDIKKQGNSFCGKKIISPEAINDFNFDYILISSPIYAGDIYAQINSMELDGKISNCINKVVSLVPVLKNFLSAETRGGGQKLMNL